MSSTRGLVLLLLCILSPSLLAASKLIIEADRVEYDHKAQRSIYSGNVVFRQKMVEIHADKVDVRHQQKGLSSITAWGSPASFQRRFVDGEVRTVRAQEIFYDVTKRRLEFKGGVEVQQSDGARLSGERVVYDLRKDVMQVLGDSGTGRVRITVPSNVLQDK